MHSTLVGGSGGETRDLVSGYWRAVSCSGSNQYLEHPRPASHPSSTKCVMLNLCDWDRHSRNGLTRSTRTERGQHTEWSSWKSRMQACRWSSAAMAPEDNQARGVRLAGGRPLRGFSTRYEAFRQRLDLSPPSLPPRSVHDPIFHVTALSGTELHDDVRSAGC